MGGGGKIFVADWIRGKKIRCQVMSKPHPLYTRRAMAFGLEVMRLPPVYSGLGCTSSWLQHHTHQLSFNHNFCSGVHFPYTGLLFINNGANF